MLLEVFFFQQILIRPQVKVICQLTLEWLLFNRGWCEQFLFTLLELVLLPTVLFL